MYAVLPIDSIKSKEKLYILDGKVSNEQYILEHIDVDIELVSAFHTTKDAIKFSGGKYRRPVVVCRTIKEKTTNMFFLHGTIHEKYNGKYVYLFQTEGEHTILSVDSALVDGGNFYLEGREYLKDFSILTTYMDDEVVGIELLLEAGTITVNLEDDRAAHGTPLNDLYGFIKEESGKLGSAAWNAQENGDYSGRLFKIHEDFLMKIMRENINNVVGKKVISEYKDYIPNDSVIALYNLLESKCTSNPWITSEDILLIEKKKEQEEARNAMLDKKIPDFELITPQGEKKRLWDHLGESKFMLIEFWASWCGPCLAEIPTMKKVYDKYKDKGFDVLSISLDAEKNSWLRALEKVNMPWKQLGIIEKADEKRVLECYHISGIPHSILINQDGMVISVGLRGVMIEKVLERLSETVCL